MNDSTIFSNSDGMTDCLCNFTFIDWKNDSVVVNRAKSSLVVGASGLHVIWLKTTKNEVKG